jgi:hypothetical protein
MSSSNVVINAKMENDSNNNQINESFDSKFSSAKFATRAIHAGQNPSQWSSGAIIPPIVMSANFALLTGKNTVSHSL